VQINAPRKELTQKKGGRSIHWAGQDTHQKVTVYDTEATMSKELNTASLGGSLGIVRRL
jgi:hypothetical protein